MKMKVTNGYNDTSLKLISAAQYGSCSSRQALSNEHLLLEIGAHGTQNGPSKFSQKSRRLNEKYRLP